MKTDWTKAKFKIDVEVILRKLLLTSDHRDAVLRRLLSGQYIVTYWSEVDNEFLSHVCGNLSHASYVLMKHKRTAFFMAGDYKIHFVGEALM